MSQKNPVKKLVQLKVLNAQDAEGREALEDLDLDALRPRVRADCLPGGSNSQRPCPWYGCRAHNGLDINEDSGSMSVRALDELVHSCALDVAEIGMPPGAGMGTGVSLEELGEILNLTKERSRQIEFQAIRHLQPILAGKGMMPDRPQKCKISDGSHGLTIDESTEVPVEVSVPKDGE